MSQKKCNCCQKLRDLELEMTRLAKEIDILKSKQKPHEFKQTEP